MFQKTRTEVESIARKTISSGNKKIIRCRYCLENQKGAGSRDFTSTDSTEAKQHSQEAAQDWAERVRKTGTERVTERVMQRKS